jgi:2,3-dihydroxybiphenyl 1,2-dioxygenase
MLISLGYIGVQGRDLVEWSDFAATCLGMQPTRTSRHELGLRMDDYKQRMFIEEGGNFDRRFFGWEVADTDALEKMATRLEGAGVQVKQEPGSIAERRRVKELISFADPAGNRLEIFHGAEIADEPFRPGRTISGFRTGPLGLGHAVLTVARIDNVIPFYRDILGFRLSDFTLRPFKAYFFHINERHHSFAVIETGTNGLHHLMVELFSLDDVGHAYDLIQDRANGIGVTLGRHTNDYMMSFYANTPSHFMIEYGWGGRLIDIANWQPMEYVNGPSLWGHERMWLPAESRAEAKALRERAAIEGSRQPVHVLTGNYTLMPGACPW